jgi:hypothetical protein
VLAEQHQDWRTLPWAIAVTTLAEGIANHPFWFGGKLWEFSWFAYQKRYSESCQNAAFLGC